MELGMFQGPEGQIGGNYCLYKLVLKDFLAKLWRFPLDTLGLSELVPLITRCLGYITTYFTKHCNNVLLLVSAC